MSARARTSAVWADKECAHARLLLSNSVVAKLTACWDNEPRFKMTNRNSQRFLWDSFNSTLVFGEMLSIFDRNFLTASTYAQGTYIGFVVLVVLVT